MFKLLRVPLCFAAGLAAIILLSPPPARALDLAEHITPGQTVHFTLDKGETKDYRLDLSKGSFYIILDARRSDGKDSNIQAAVELLKQNGVVIDSTFLNVNVIGITSRSGKLFHLAQPMGVRLRLKHDLDIPLEFWLTVLPGSAMKFIPFGFGGDVKPAAIGVDAGVGGTLDPYQSVYYRVTLPPGKWSISLGFKLPDDDKSNLQGHIDILDPYGFVQTPQFVVLNEIDNESRKEGFITVTKPRTIILDVVSENNRTYTYNITIQKAEGGV